MSEVSLVAVEKDGRRRSGDPGLCYLLTVAGFLGTAYSARVLPWQHSPPAAELRFPPLLSQGKTKGFRQVVPRNTLSPERHIFGVKAIIIKDYSLT